MRAQRSVTTKEGLHKNLVFWNKCKASAVDSITGTAITVAGTGSFITTDGFGGGYITGTGTSFDCGNTPTIGTSDFTVSARVKTGVNTGSQWIMIKEQQTVPYYGFGFMLSSGKPYISVLPNYPTNYAEQTATTSIADNVWHTLTASVHRKSNGVDMVIYLDGATVASTQGGAGLSGDFTGSITTDAAAASHLFLASDPAAGGSFNGSLGNFKIYKGIAVNEADALRIHRGLEPLARV